MRRAHVIEVRPAKPEDGAFLADHCAWVATDSAGRRFGADTEIEARQWAEDYNNPSHTSRERGRVSHPTRGST
jgi:hypothetical protein